MSQPESYGRSVRLLVDAAASRLRRLETARTVRGHLFLAQRAERDRDAEELKARASRIFAWGCAYRQEKETRAIWKAMACGTWLEGSLLPILARHPSGTFEIAGKKAAVESAFLIDVTGDDDDRLFVFRQWIEGEMITSDGRLTTELGLFHEVAPAALRAVDRIIRDDGQVYKNIESYLKDEAIRLASGR